MLLERRLREGSIDLKQFRNINWSNVIDRFVNN